MYILDLLWSPYGRRCGTGLLTMLVLVKGKVVSSRLTYCSMRRRDEH